MNKNKIIGLGLGILIVLVIVVSSTYAYWQITKTQKTPNDIVAACLDLSLNDKDAANPGIDLDNAWPITDEEASNLTGYTFTVTNNCNEEINYIVGLNRVEESNYLLDSSIKLQLDENSSHVYGDLSDVEYSDAENTEYTARSSKQVSVETIGANGTNTHTIRIWVSEDAPVTEQSKTFLGQVFITGGQGIEVPICYMISHDGIILDYDESCGLEVKVPTEVNGIKVKTIRNGSFTSSEAIGIQTIKGTQQALYVVYLDESDKDILDAAMLNYVCQELGICGIQNVTDIAKVLTMEEYLEHDWTQYDQVFYENYNINYETGELIEYDISSIVSLDLSDAIYLEEIGYRAFSGQYKSEQKVDDSCYHYTSGGDYYMCNGLLKKLVLPKNGALKEIKSYAFQYNQLTELIIPASVEELKLNAFHNNRITSLIFEDTLENPSNLSTINYELFKNNNLTKVIIPSSVEVIGARAFYNNPNLSEVIIKNTEENVVIETAGSDGAFPATTTITYNPNYTE